ncbi:MAG: hypothetical protein Q9166_007777 [cf. Caloplaca sp. 2 TL-2023]
MAVDSSLESKLAASLPKNQRFTIHHLSTPPTPCPAIYSAPPGQKPEKTSCESHLLSVSVNHDDHRIQVFALEVLIYSTHNLTTLFVSKADSTGYIHLLKLPKGTPSPVKTISSIFTQHLVEIHQRKDRQLVVSLFARAQDQYLFPGSIENPGKHVLDDRGLIKWWCRVLEPVLQANKPNTHATAKAYLRVPSCDLHETRSFFPPHVRRTPSLLSTWHANRDPLRDLAGRSPTFPERCLIPRFPDDPKSRFVDELDEELTEPPPESQTKASPSKGKRPGRWKSVKSLEQFWELMAFRQECSSGRLVGFLWAVFTPEGMEEQEGGMGPTPFSMKMVVPTPNGSQESTPHNPPLSSPTKHPLSPTLFSPTSKYTSDKRSVSSKSLIPPSHTNPTTLVLPSKHYARINRLLLHLDYATLDLAAESSKRWIEDVGLCAERTNWGFEALGEKEELAADAGGGGGRQDGKGAEAGEANVLGMGLVRKKKRDAETERERVAVVGGVGDGDGPGDGEGVDILATTGLVRKKQKVK